MNYKVYLTSSAKAKKLKKTSTPYIVVIEPEDFTKDEITSLKDKGYSVLGYLSIGSVSDERPYYKELKPYCLKPVDDWPHEKYLDLRRTKVRDWCVKQAKAIKALGCNGWWLDNIDIYEEYKSSAMYQAILSTLRRISGLGGFVMLNGGSAFCDEKLSKEAVLAAYKVQCGAFIGRNNAEEIVRKLQENNINAVIKMDRRGEKVLNIVQAGAFSDFSNAYSRMCGIKSLGIDAIIKLEGENTAEIALKSFVNAVNQEEVFTRIKNYDGKGEFGSQTSEQSHFYREYMCKLVVHGLDTFLLEYSRDAKLVAKIKKFVKVYKMTGYYVSSEVNL